MQTWPELRLQVSSLSASQRKWKDRLRMQCLFQAFWPTVEFKGKKTQHLTSGYMLLIAGKQTANELSLLPCILLIFLREKFLVMDFTFPVVVNNAMLRKRFFQIVAL